MVLCRTLCNRQSTHHVVVVVLCLQETSRSQISDVGIRYENEKFYENNKENEYSTLGGGAMFTAISRQYLYEKDHHCMLGVLIPTEICHMFTFVFM